MILMALWAVVSLAIFVLHRRERRILMAQIESFKEKSMFSAALGVAKKAAEVFPGENEIINLKQNLEFIVSKESEKKNALKDW